MSPEAKAQVMSILGDVHQEQAVECALRLKQKGPDCPFKIH